MNQGDVSSPGVLQCRCMSVIMERLPRLERTDSFDQLPLPPSIVERMKGIRRWRQDMFALLTRTPFDRFRYDCENKPRDTSPFNAHFRFSSANGSIKIDHRATACAQLEHFDPSGATQSSIDFALVLASTYCMLEHVRRILCHWRPLRSIDQSPNINPMVGYWVCELGGGPQTPDPSVHLHKIHPYRRCSPEFWLSVVRSFCPIVALRAYDFHVWINTVLEHALEYGHKSCIQFAWDQHTDKMRRSLVNTYARSSTLLKSVLRADEKVIFNDVMERFDNAAARREAIKHLLIEDDCVVIFRGHRGFDKREETVEMFERFYDYVILDADNARSSIHRAEIAEPLCKSLATSWTFLTAQKRARITNEFDDLLRDAIEFNQRTFAMCIWNEEQQQMRRFVLLFRDECAAFRSSCAKGYLELVRVFWEWASIDQRCRMIGSKYGDAMRSAARSGHLSVVQYLWENMDSRIAYEAMYSHAIDDVSLSRLIIVSAAKMRLFDGGPPNHELENFLSKIISTTSNEEREPIYPVSAMKTVLVNALASDNGKALNVLVQRAKDGDPTVLRSLLDAFNEDQRVRLRSKLTTDDDIKLCGLDSLENVAASLQAMTIRVVGEKEHGPAEEEADEEHDDEDEEEAAYSEVIDLTELDEYYEG